jgi:tetratricopeptide (TPR) repeat protein
MKPFKDMKVLISDDSSNMLRTMVNMLRLLGFLNLDRADNGETALQKARTGSYDLILSDWNMPKMNGTEFLRAVRDDEALKATPFIIVTGEVDQSTVAEAGEIDVDAYLLKPFTHEDLKKKIDEVFEKKRNPSEMEIHLNVAKVYVEARQYDQALDELRKALKQNPRSPRLCLLMGQVMEEKGDMENAGKMYERSVQFGHQFIKGHEALARVANAQGDTEKAAEHLKQAARISPNNIERNLNLSQVLIKSGQTQEAQKLLKTVLRQADQNKAEICLQVGETLLQAGMAEEASDVFQQALKADPSAIHIYNRLGIALRRQKKFKEAIDNYRMAIKIDPENENLYYNLGRAYYDVGNKDMSAAAMKKALKIYPEFAEARNFLGKIA